MSRAKKKSLRIKRYECSRCARQGDTTSFITAEALAAHVKTHLSRALVRMHAIKVRKMLDYEDENTAKGAKYFPAILMIRESLTLPLLPARNFADLVRDVRESKVVTALWLDPNYGEQYDKRVEKIKKHMFDTDASPLAAWQWLQKRAKNSSGLIDQRPGVPETTERDSTQANTVIEDRVLQCANKGAATETATCGFCKQVFAVNRRNLFTKENEVFTEHMKSHFSEGQYLRLSAANASCAGKH
jgi:hypothetical protein